jgi:predicted ABC-type ATPase
VNLLTDAKIAEASEEDLVDTLRAINEHMGHLDERAAIDAARLALADHGITAKLRLRFDVEEWENGYFYRPVVSEVEDSGYEFELPQVVVDALEEALDEPLGVLGHNGPRIGRRHHMTINLAHDIIERW